MIVACIEDVPVAFVCLAHKIQYTAFSYLLSRAFVLEVPPPPALIRIAPFIPMDESQGLSGADSL
jgi:hypothetical protein